MTGNDKRSSLQDKESITSVNIFVVQTQATSCLRAWHLVGDNLKLVLAKFSILGWLVLLISKEVCLRRGTHTPKVENLVKVFFGKRQQNKMFKS